MTEPSVRLLRIAEAAERLSISRSRAYQMAQAGDLPGLVKLGASLRVNARALEAWVEQNSAPGRTAA